MHFLAVVVEERIDWEVAEQGVSPVQSRRATSLLLTSRRKTAADVARFVLGASAR
jgi:hypothetical protein